MAIEKIGVDIKSNAKDIEKQLKDIDSRIKDLKSSKPTIQINAEKLGNAKKEINSVNVQLKELSAKKALIKADASNIEDAKKKMADITAQMDKLRARKAVLQVTTEKLKGADQDLKKLDREMQQLNNKKAYLQVDSQNISETESKLSSLKSKLMQIGTTKTKIDISANLDKLGSQLDGVGNKMLGVLNPFTSKINQMIGFGAIMRGVDGAINMVSGSVDGAINRFDTLNNSTRSFENMGIEAGVVKDEIENLKGSIQGLPTPIDGAISNVQLLTASTNDMGKSVKVFQAMNDGILGFGGDVQMVDNAVVQLSQSFSNGKIDAQTWNSMINSGLGPSLNAMAKKMNMTTGQMKESLSDGTISVEQFQDALIDLDKNGGAGMKSLQTIVKDATSGIKTGIANMKTAVVRGSASIIKTTDNILQKAGFKGFAGVFASIGETFEKNLTKVSDLLEKNQDKIISFVSTVKNQFASLGSFDKVKFFEGLKESFTSTAEAGKSFINTMSPLINVAKNLITKLGDGSFEKGLGKLPALFLKAAIASKVLGKSLKLLSKLNIKLPSFGKGKEGLATTFGAFKGNMFDSLTSFAKNSSNLVLIFGAIKVIEAAAEAMKHLNEKVPSDLKNVAEKVGGMALAISSIGVLAFIAGKLPLKEMTVGLVAVAAVSLEIMLAAEALKQLNEKVPSSIKNVAKKMVNVGIAIGGMALLVGVIGGLSLVGWPVALAGLASVALLAGELILVSEAIKQLDDKVPTDFDSLKTKLKTITSVLDSIVESNLTKFGTLFDSIIAGFTTISFIKVIDNLIIVSNKLEKLNSSSKKINKNKTIKIIENLKDIIKVLSNNGSFLSSIGKWFKGKIDTAVFDNIKLLLSKAVSITDDLAKLDEGLKAVEKLKFNKEAVLITINAITDVVNEMNLGGGLFSSLEKLVQADLDQGTLEKSKKSLANITKLNDALKNIEIMKFNKEAVLLTIGGVKDIVNEMLLDGGLFTSLTRLAKVSIDSSILEKSKESLQNISDLNIALKNIEVMKFNKDAVLITVGAIKEVIDAMSIGEGLFHSLGLFIQKGVDNGTIEKSIITLNSLSTLNDSMKNIEVMKFNKGNVLITIGAIKEVINETIVGDSLFSSLDIFIQKGMDNGTLEKAKQSIGYLASLNDSIKELEVMKFTKDAVLITIGGIKDVLNETMLDGGLLSSVGRFVKNFFDNDSLEKSKSTLKSISDLNTAIKDIEILKFNKGNVLITIGAVGDVIEALNNFSVKNNIGDTNFNGMIESFSTLISKIKALEPEFNVTGKTFGEAVIKGFKNANVPSTIISSIDKLIKDLKNKNSSFTAIGKGWGDSLKNAFTSAISGLVNAVTGQINSLNSQSTSFSMIGTNYGQSLINGFNKSVVSLSESIGNQVKAIQLSLNNLKAPDLDAKVRTNGRTTTLSKGGSVPEYHSVGGLTGVFKRKGTDTVPAMLTPGEFVQRRAAVNTFGLDFMNRVNNLDVQGAFQALTGRFNNRAVSRQSVSSVVNNINNSRTNNAKVVQNIHSDSQNYNSLGRMRRELRRI